MIAVIIVACNTQFFRLCIYIVFTNLALVAYDTSRYQSTPACYIRPSPGEHLELHVYVYIFMADYLLINVGTNCETDGHVDRRRGIMEGPGEFDGIFELVAHDLLVCVISSELERGSNGAFRVIIKIEEISSEGRGGGGFIVA